MHSPQMLQASALVEGPRLDLLDRFAVAVDGPEVAEAATRRAGAKRAAGRGRDTLLWWSVPVDDFLRPPTPSQTQVWDEKGFTTTAEAHVPSVRRRGVEAAACVTPERSEETRRGCARTPTRPSEEHVGNSEARSCLTAGGGVDTSRQDRPAPLLRDREHRFRCLYPGGGVPAHVSSLGRVRCTKS